MSKVRSRKSLSVDDLNAHLQWFHDPDRKAENGPFVIVVDDFYEDPDEIRRIALSKEFVQYSPPPDDQVGEETASLFAGVQPCWFSSAWLRFRGKPIVHPTFGHRYAPAILRERFTDLLNEKVVEGTWETMGDGWNGAFHLMNEHFFPGNGAIHHHYKEGDVYPRGWSGVVYLTPDAPQECGTSIWRHRGSGLCIATWGVQFFRGEDADLLEPVFLAENRYNRLVLFRENVLHRVEQGFGTTRQNMRLTQTFFFQTEDASLDL